MTFQNLVGMCLLEGSPRSIQQGYLCSQEWQGYMRVNDRVIGYLNDGLCRLIPHGHAARSGKDT